jgi:hypothetical protein
MPASSSGNRPTICSSLHLQHTLRRRFPTNRRRILRSHSRRSRQSRSRLGNHRHSRRRNLRTLHTLYN